MSNIAIVDTSALISLIKTDDSLYRRAQVTTEAIESSHTLILPYEVFAETLNTLGKKLNNADAIKAGRAILEDGFVLMEATTAVLSATLTKLEQQKNSVSFIDCLVMTWADHYQTKNIFGFDSAFAANGYCLPSKTT